MAEIAASMPMLIIVFLITVGIMLVIFQQSVTDIFAKEEELGKIDDISSRVSRAVAIQGEPNVRLESCTKDSAYRYRFRVTGLEASFQGLPTDSSAAQMAVFATLMFKGADARDTQDKIVTLKKGVAEPFGDLEFEVGSGVAPLRIFPDTPTSIGDLQVKQSLVLNNYKITAARQLSVLNIGSCYTDLIIECKSESARASLTSRSEDPDNYKKTVVVCGGRVDLQLLDYHSGVCGSRPLQLYAEARKQADGWEYADRAIISFWRSDAAACWQEPGKLGCGEKLLGSKTFNLTRENYNVGGCEPVGTFL